uniref:Uncharacterized protein n=1 Tax=Ignisphaera aggregans TaxID=334771 RepID=A0A7C5XMA3_9CREN
MVSPYINFNILLGLNIINELVGSIAEKGIVICSYKVSSELVKEIIDEYKDVVFLNSFTCLNNSNVYVIILSNIEADSLLRCFVNADKLFVLVEKVWSLNKLRNAGWSIYRVKRVDQATYSLLNIYEDEVVLLNIKGYAIYQSQIPEDVILIYREVVNHVREFGSIKASDLLRYMVKVLGYDKEFILNAIRRSIAIGILGYQSGYLFPKILINA